MFKMKIMKKLVSMFFGFAILSVVVGCSSPQQGNNSDKKVTNGVYVTKSGKKYHKEWCRTIKGRDTKIISIREAESRGKSKCKVCF